MQACHRFVILYFGLYFLPFPLPSLAQLTTMPRPVRWVGDAAGWLAQAFQNGFDALAVWVGERVLGLSAVPIRVTGSGDTTAAYIQTLCVLVLAAVGTLIWWVRGRAIPPRVVAAFRIYLRYAVAAVLLTYGFSKVPPLQFQPPGPEMLIRTYGDSSPMGLLWTFMGASPAYTMFAGVMEIVPGLLLLFRPTTTVGALIGAATMANVVALNFCYDVPVKLYSVHLLLSLIVIAAPDVPRVLTCLVRNRATTPQAPVQLASVRPAILAVAKAAFVLMLLAGNVSQAWQGWYTYGPGAPVPPLTGVYDVESFSANGVPRPPLWTDTRRWRRLLISRRGYVVVQLMGGANQRFSLERDEKAGTFALRVMGTGDAYTLSRTQPAPDRLVLEGVFRGEPLRVELKKAGDATFLLNSRGFNWVQEVPFNR